MKKQIRRGVFETNSSSVHSLTMCSSEEYEKWKNEEILYDKYEHKFGTREEMIEHLKSKSYYSNTDWSNEDEVNDAFADEEIQTFQKFFDNEYYETFVEHYTTNNGEKIVAFGYYGEGY